MDYTGNFKEFLVSMFCISTWGLGELILTVSPGYEHNLYIPRVSVIPPPPKHLFYFICTMLN